MAVAAEVLESVAALAAVEEAVIEVAEAAGVVSLE